MNEAALRGILGALGAALVLAAGLHFARRTPDATAGGAPRWTPGWGALAGILVGLVALEGLHYPPVASKQKALYVCAGAGLFGLLLDLVRARAASVAGAACASIVAGLAWIAWRPLTGGGDDAPVAAIAALAVGGCVFLAAVAHLDPGDALEPAIALLAAAVGVAGIAALGASATLALFSATGAAAAGGVALVGFALRLFGAQGFPLGAAGILGIGTTLVAFGAILALFAPHAHAAALAPLVLVPLGVLAARRPPLPERAERPLRPILGTLGALVPAAAALAWAAAVAE